MENKQTLGMQIMWYQKKEFIMKTINSNPYNSEVFVWIDAGCIKYEEWMEPQYFGRKNNFVIDQNKVYIG